MRSTFLTVVLFLTTVGPSFTKVAHAGEGDAANAPRPADNDFLFPGNGKVSLTATTGLPFAALGEVSLGVSDRFAAGGVIAGGPFLGGVATGIHLRLDALRGGPMRLLLEGPCGTRTSPIRTTGSSFAPTCVSRGKRAVGAFTGASARSGRR